MTDHARLIATAIGARPPVRVDVALMIASAERAAAATDAVLPIATAIVAALRSANILLPMPSTIERAGIAGRAHAHKSAARMMVADLSPVQLGRIDALFIENDGARLGWLKTVPVATKTESVRDIVEQDPLVIAGDKYATLRKFAPMQIEVLEFMSARGSAASVKAINLLRDLNASGKRDVPADAPMPFRKEWRRLVVGADGRINRRLYETATMVHIRNKLWSGDIWVERSSAYRRFDSYFLSAEASAPIAAGLNLPTSADTWLAERAASLDHRLKQFAHNLSNGRLGGVWLVDGRLQITPVRTESDTEARALGNRIDGLMPRIRIAELLHDVASGTGFLGGFTNLRTGRQSDNHNALLAAILADGTNLGIA